MSSPGSSSFMARTTDSPPTPESNTPMGSWFIIRTVTEPSRRFQPLQFSSRQPKATVSVSNSGRDKGHLKTQPLGRAVRLRLSDELVDGGFWRIGGNFAGNDPRGRRMPKGAGGQSWKGSFLRVRRGRKGGGGW